MIVDAICIECKTAHTEYHPIGWAHIVVTALVREKNEKVNIVSMQKHFHLCEKCFEQWWMGKKGG